MEPWSPLRGKSKRQAGSQPRKARGRRRQHLTADQDSPGAILTDVDAAYAAELARQERNRPLAPAWERFASAPLQPRREAADASDTILKAADAEAAGRAAVMGQAATATGSGRAARDYGTGPAYDPASMR